MNNKNIGYFLAAIVAFLAGFFYYSKNNKKQQADESINKTLAKQKDGRFFLIYNSVVILSREVSKDQYDLFLKQYPTGMAPSNVLNDFSTPPTRYTAEAGKYYEYTWNGSEYNNPIEIEKEEYCFLRNKAIIPQLMDDINI